MRCEEAQPLWLQAHAAEASRGEALEEHMAHCVDCTAFAAAQVQLDGLLALDEDQPPRPGFDTRFFALLEDEKRAAHAPSGVAAVLQWLLPGLAVAAAVALLVTGQPAVETASTSVPTAQDASRVEAAEVAMGALLEASEEAVEDLAVAQDLELLKELPVLEQLDELEAYEVLAQLDLSELDALLEEGRTL